MIKQFTTQLTNSFDISIDHDSIKSVDYDIEEIIIDIDWYVELSIGSSKSYCEVIIGIDKVTVDAKIYEIDTEKWRYIDEMLFAGGLSEWDIDLSSFEMNRGCMDVSIQDIIIDFKLKQLTIN